MVDTTPASGPETSPSDTEILTSVDVTMIGANDNIVSDISWTQIILAESIFVPGLQTSIRVQNNSNFLPIKDFDTVKGIPLNLKITRPALKKHKDYNGNNFKDTMELNQVIYRLGGRSSTIWNATDNRKLINRAVEELTFHACDPTLLYDASSLVSKSWKCTTPTQVVSEVLISCAGVKNLKAEPSDPARDYIAENKHPFQVAAQQANVALAEGNDPSFLHFMTYEKAETGQGTHHFRSLRKMTQQSPIVTLNYDEFSAYANPNAIMTYYFPCDFDLLSDILNGVGSDGSVISSVALFNPGRGSFSLYGNQNSGCGIGAGVYKLAITNAGSEKSEYSCPDYSYLYYQKRQARMGMLEKDKIALRLTVPWNPIYNVGKMIQIKLLNPEDKQQQVLKYGSGDYLIVALVHNIVSGGYSTVTLDCVSRTVGSGEV